MKIAYATTYDAQDKSNWSGLGFYISRALRNSGVEIDYVQAPRSPFEAVGVARKLLARAAGKAFYAKRDTLVLKHQAREIGRRIAASDVDAVFSPGTLPFAYLETDRPICLWTDATFAAMHEYYPEFIGMSRAAIAAGHAADTAAFGRAALCAFTCDWAAQSAINDYGVDPSRVIVLPFGANMENLPGEAETEAAIAARPTDRFELLFIGVDWARKGGDIAVDAVRRLNAQGYPTRMTVVGAEPPEAAMESGFVDYLGWIRKNEPEGERRLAELLGRAHALILPTQAECYGVVLAEAAAFGTPSVVTQTGGVASAVEDGVSGDIIPPEAGGEGFATALAALFSDRAAYERRAKAAFDHYWTRLDWAVNGALFRDRLAKLVKRRPKSRRTEKSTRAA